MSYEDILREMIEAKRRRRRPFRIRKEHPYYEYLKPILVGRKRLRTVRILPYEDWEKSLEVHLKDFLRRMGKLEKFHEVWALLKPRSIYNQLKYRSQLEITLPVVDERVIINRFGAVGKRWL